ncbi:MAG: pyrophosphorylase [Actinomycetota bacterium]|nr:pyrophosphorylase [Actinomycetota bacterium]
MTRVLSTDQARASIDRIRSLANDQLTSDLSALQAEGSTLSDPNIWDGLEAARFRGDTWPSVDRALKQAVSALQSLQQQAQSINQNIMAAGGNA